MRICDTSSEPAVTASLDAIAASAPITLVLSTSDYYLHMAALQADRLALAGPHPDAIALCRDKARQAEALFAAGVGVPPRSITVSTLADAPRAIVQVGLPAVIKPISGTGSIGVSLAENEAEVITALEALLTVTFNPRGQAVAPRALLMSYVQGDEFSVEILDDTVIGVTKKHLGALPHFVEIGHDFPAPIAAGLRERIEREAIRAIRALGLARGPAHVELRVTPNAVIIIEVNPRLAGGSIPSLIRHAIGLDPVAAVLESARRGGHRVVPAKMLHGSLRFIVPRVDGHFHPSCGLAETINRFALDEAVLYRPLPVDFRRTNDFRDRLGHVIAVDADPIAAARRADAAVDLVCQP